VGIAWSYIACSSISESRFAGQGSLLPQPGSRHTLLKAKERSYAFYL